MNSFGWLDIEIIVECLMQAHPEVDPLTLRFTALRAMVEALEGFEPDPEHPVNERILETIQAEWIAGRSGQTRDDD